MFTPPYHFSIVATPSLINPYPTEILYRGSIPAARNLTSLRRLHLRTLVYLRKKELKDDDALREWAKREKVELRWVKVEEMGEESLGMGRMELGEVLKVNSPSQIRGRQSPDLGVGPRLFATPLSVVELVKVREISPFHLKSNDLVPTPAPRADDRN